MATPTSGLAEKPFWCFSTFNEDTGAPPLGASRHASDVGQKMKAIVILVASLALLSCSDQGSEVAKVAKVSPSRELAERLTQADTVVFESWDGKLKGADSDSLLHFHRDSAVVLEERSIGIRSFDGTYEVDSDGTVRVDIPGYDGSWPTMKLDLSVGSVLDFDQRVISTLHRDTR